MDDNILVCFKQSSLQCNVRNINTNSIGVVEGCMDDPLTALPFYIRKIVKVLCTRLHETMHILIIREITKSEGCKNKDNLFI